MWNNLKHRALSGKLNFFVPIIFMDDTVLILSGSMKDGKHVGVIKELLHESGIESRWEIASAHKQADDVAKHVHGYNDWRLPLITIAGRSDALSGCAAFMSNNPVISSRPDWKDIESLQMIFFSSVYTTATLHLVPCSVRNRRRRM